MFCYLTQKSVLNLRASCIDTRRAKALAELGRFSDALSAYEEGTDSIIPFSFFLSITDLFLSCYFFMFNTPHHIALTVEPGSKAVTQELNDLKKRIQKKQQQAEDEIRRKAEAEAMRAQAEAEKKNAAATPFAPAPATSAPSATSATAGSTTTGEAKKRKRVVKKGKKGSKNGKEVVKPYLPPFFLYFILLLLLL